jgi:hypothetical protein
MKRKLYMPILGLFEALREVYPTAKHKTTPTTPWRLALGNADRTKQTPANPAKKARRKMMQASQHRNRR